MSRTVQNLKDSVSGILTGTDLDNVTDLNGCLERAARTVVQKAYIPDSLGREEIVLYDGVYDYPAPDTIFGTTVTDLRPQGNTRTPWDFVYKKPGQQFDREKKFLSNGAELAFENNKGISVARIVSTKPTKRIIIDSMSDKDDWIAENGAGTIYNDASVFYDNDSSIRFSGSSSTSEAGVSKTLDTSIDLTDYVGVGVAFLAIRLTDVSSINTNGIVLEIGNDANNVWSIKVTSSFIGSFQNDEWMVLSFDLATATTIGTVNPAKIDFEFIDINYNSGTGIANINLGGLWISLPSPHTMLFKSAAVFQQSGKNPALSIHDHNDTIILNDAAYNLLLYESAANVCFNMGGKLSGGQLSSINGVLHGIRARNGAVIQFGLYDLYRADNPDESVRNTGNYYDD